MAARLIWSIEALGDLDAMAEYIYRDSPLHAQPVVEAALALAESAAEEPVIGRMVPALRERVHPGTVPVQLSPVVPAAERPDRSAGAGSRTTPAGITARSTRVSRARGPACASVLSAACRQQLRSTSTHPANAVHCPPLRGDLQLAAG